MALQKARGTPAKMRAKAEPIDEVYPFTTSWQTDPSASHERAKDSTAVVISLVFHLVENSVSLPFSILNFARCSQVSFFESNGAAHPSVRPHTHTYKLIFYLYLFDWSDSEMEDSLAFGELRFRSKTKAGLLEDKQLSRAGNIALVR